MELKRIAGADGPTGSSRHELDNGGDETEFVNQESVIEGREGPDIINQEAHDYGGEREQNSNEAKGKEKSLDDILIDFITRRGRK